MDLSAFVQGRLLLARNRRLSRERFERERLARFRKFAHYIQRHSPWYRRIMAECKIDPTHCHPEQFPVLTKSEVIHHFDEIVTARDVTRRDVEDFLHRSHNPRELFRGRYTVIHTSGSSGETGFFIYDKAAWARVLSQLASAKGFRLISLGRKRVAFFGVTQGHYAGVTMSLSATTLPFSLIYKTRVFEINRPISDVVRGMNDFQPDVILGYGNALKELAEKQRQGELHISPESVSSSAEPLLDADRAVIEEVFGDCVKNAYACTEFGIMGLREPSWRYMRLLEDYLIFDIASDHALVTSISNHILPLVRYRLNDVLSVVPSDEHAPYQAIADVVGRVETLAKFRNRHGDIGSISPATVNEIVIPYVRGFQMRLQGPEAFGFAVVFDSTSGDTQREEALAVANEKLRAILREKDMENVTFEVFPVDDLPADPKSGKFKFIVPAPAVQN